MDLQAYVPLGILLLMAVFFAVFNIGVSLVLGPRRDGPVKQRPYESGMDPLTPARKRFNVRFYMLAMVFLVFDVEVIFLYPWAATFRNVGAGSAEAAVFLGRILFFLFTTVVALLYAYRKGVVRFA